MAGAAFSPPDKLPKLENMRVRRQFLFTARGTAWRTRGVVIQARRRPAQNPDESRTILVGFTATRKTGTAVVRNRARRRLRALAQACLPLWGVGGVNYVFIVRLGTAERPWSDLKTDVETALTSLRQRLIDER